MIKAAIFDLDGTLLDTLADIRFVLNETLSHFSYPEITEAQTKEYIGEGALRLVERALPANAENIDEVFVYYKNVYASCRNEHTRPFEGIIGLLQGLKKRGVKIGILTNKPQAATEECVKQFFSEIPFDFVGGDGGLFPCKPDPAYAQYAALKLRVLPAECVFIGDGETDAQTAIRAGMTGVSVLWGYRTRVQLEAAGATRFVSEVKELEEFLKKG